ncbi:hypothetical protein GGR58DRAFT_496492 [Xylaria digitata]|nr:hypothetical protein GGR58DRAFT_496492 [Xylaria digitata]
MRFSVATALLGASLVYAAPASPVKKSEVVAKTPAEQEAPAPLPKDAKRDNEAAAPWPLYVAKDAKRSEEEAPAPWPLYVAKDAKRDSEAAAPWPLYVVKDGAAVEQ